MKIKMTSAMIVWITLLVACSSENNTMESQELNVSETDTELVSVEASFEYYTFNEAIHNADLIAEIQIENTVKEIEDPIEKTIIEVKVLDVIVGNDERKLIKIFQHGTKNVRFNEIDLFNPGENYVLFLRETIATTESDYWIQGEESGIYKVLENGLIKIKWPYEELNEIQISEIDDNSNSYSNDGIRQLLDKEAFIELVREVAKEGEGK